MEIALCRHGGERILIMLRLLGFEYLQGWHFGAPMTARALAERMNNAA